MSINGLSRVNAVSRITGSLKASAIVTVPGSVITSPAPENRTDYKFNGSAPITFEGNLKKNIYSPPHQSKEIRAVFSDSVDILVVGGGGGTLSPISAAPPGYCGGGGAGGVAHLENGTITSGTSYTVTIGAGGPGLPRPNPYTYPVTGTNGQNSSFVGTGYNIVARGGGGADTGGNPGGSGGGASYPPSSPVGEGTQPAQSQTAPSPVTNYGNHGGPTFPFTSWPSSYHSSSGGGGAGGNSIYPGSPLLVGTPGGPGVTLMGVTVGGGGGGRGSTNGLGGPGGGGTAGLSNGTANTGGGGGGGQFSGGSGVVIIRY